MVTDGRDSMHSIDRNCSRLTAFQPDAGQTLDQRLAHRSQIKSRFCKTVEHDIDHHAKAVNADSKSSFAVGIKCSKT